MKRKKLLLMTTASVLLVVSVLLMTYYHGTQPGQQVHVTQAGRQVNVNKNVLDWKQDSKPVVIKTKEEMSELLRLARSRLPDYDGRDAYGLAAFESSMKDFDFTEELLVLIPFMQGMSYDVGLIQPYMESRQLYCHIWFKNRTYPFTSPAAGFACIGVAVKKDLVDSVQIKFGEGKADAINLK